MAAAPISKQIVAIGAIVVVLLIGLAVFFVMGGCGGSGVTPKSSVNDYTWEELSKISAEIGRKADESDAVEVAKKYNLVNAEGKLDGTQTKMIELSDGSTAMVQIAGLSHDDKTGGGKAGITFIFKDAIAEHDMNSSETNSGGWEASQMRSWLASEGLVMLPQDLSSKIIAVDKKTNNVGETTSISSVTTTSDKLWLFSLTELCGTIEGSWNSDTDVVLNAEGSEYKLFRDCNVDKYESNGILIKSHNESSPYWWGRSPYPDHAIYFNSVNLYGEPGIGLRATELEGVVPGFCI